MPLNRCPRVAFLADTFHEVNGVAHTVRQLVQFAKRRNIPFLDVHCGAKEEISNDGSVTTIELQRGRFSVELDAQLEYDPFLLRHTGRISAAIKDFRAELIHVTGPGDMGAIGRYLAWRLGLPFVASWHTSLDQYARLRLERSLAFLGRSISQDAGRFAGKLSLRFLRWFYRRACIALAPNDELVETLKQLTGRPVFLMRRGVDAELFSPARRNRENGRFRIGYVGRLTAEKNVRFLADLANALKSRAKNDFEIVIVGQGSEEQWLEENVPNVSLTGVLHGEALAQAYANLDLFVFPSKTDTFGNVVLEALSSGVPAIVTSGGGPKWLVQDGITGYVAVSDEEFIEQVICLMDDQAARLSMAQAARGYACKQSWDNVFERVFRAYESCLPLASPLSAEISH